MALYRGSIAALGTPKTTSTPSSSITFTTASITSIRATGTPPSPRARRARPHTPAPPSPPPPSPPASITSIRATAKPAFPDPRPAVASAYLVPRLVLDDPQQRRVVLAAPALPPHGQEHLVDDGRDWQRDAVLPPGRERYAEVLVVQLRAETGVEVVGEELLALDLHHLVARQPATEDVQDLLRRNPALRAEHQRLRDRL